VSRAPAICVSAFANCWPHTQHRRARTHHFLWRRLHCLHCANADRARRRQCPADRRRGKASATASSQGARLDATCTAAARSWMHGRKGNPLQEFIKEAKMEVPACAVVSRAVSSPVSM
jgi:hypothetical protein